MHESILDEVGKHLGIGLGSEGVALLQQRVTKLGIILNDAVVDYRDVSATIGMRMGIGIVGSPVRSPASMTNAERTGNRG